MLMCNDIPDASVVAAADVAVTVDGPSPSPSPNPLDPPDKPIFTPPTDAKVPLPPVVLSATPLGAVIRRPVSPRVLLPVIGQGQGEI